MSTIRAIARERIKTHPTKSGPNQGRVIAPHLLVTQWKQPTPALPQSQHTSSACRRVGEVLW
ncbi:MAG: hypothetical protein SAK29_33550 [Scytonema sp. PMC 1069.18]|nr:hypothetical protein [Scytonema sp. PMC 1069.18]MEC4887808.1 hypothetical protein [Scytonema sp. PMC 1070.18]